MALNPSIKGKTLIESRSPGRVRVTTDDGAPPRLYRRLYMASTSSPPPLSAEEVAFFVREGWLLKRGVLDPAQCAAARDALWASNTSSRLRRDEPETWFAPIAKEDESLDMMNHRSGDQWRLRGMCSTPLVLDMFPRLINHWFEQLLGKDEVVQPFEGSRRGWNNWGGFETRGVYCVLPTADSVPVETEADRRAELARGLNSAHVDPQPSHMVAACYIDEVPERGGGFCIFPRSHHELFARDPAFADMAQASFNYPDEERAIAHGAPVDQVSLVGNPRFKPSLTEAYQETKQHVISTIAPLQIAGGEGDVILTHGRTFHMGSRNLSSQIRQAMFYDVVKKEVDAKFSAQVDDRGIPDQSHNDMWHDWSDEVRRAAAKGTIPPFESAKL